MKVKIGIVLMLLLAGCSSGISDNELNGRITLWHSWSQEQAIILEEILDQFQEIHPGVTIITVYLPEDHMAREFHRAGKDGLGPGLLIGRDHWIGELADTGLIRPVSVDEDSTNLFSSRTSKLVRYQDQVYGIPLTLAPMALYYNKSLVPEPPETLEELLQEAAEGQQVAFVPRFEEAYWGIQAFGEGLFDNQGHFTLAESGFEEWLSWLNEAQSAPGVILNVDDQSLMELFATEQIAFYVAGPEKRAFIEKLIDPENPFEFGIAHLPDGPHGPAGPLLPAETILLYAYTSPEQTRITNALAAYLVNQQQSIRFMRELRRIPANPFVAIDRRIYPIVHGFAQQANSAVVIPNEISVDPWVEAGDRAYVTALSGITLPAEAICNFGQEIMAIQGYSADQVRFPEGCQPLSDESSDSGSTTNVFFSPGDDNG